MSPVPAPRRIYWAGWAVVMALSLTGLLLLRPGQEPWLPLLIHLLALGLARAVIHVVHGQVSGRMRWLRHGWPITVGAIFLAGGIAATGGGWAWWVVAFAPIIAFRWSL